MDSIVSVRGVSKTYKGGFQALKNVNLDIQRGEIFALLGPNGAGKTTLIGIICGIVNKTSGTVTVGGHDNVNAFRAARQMIGLVPQELHLSIFESVWDTVSFSRRLFGKPSNPVHIERILKLLSLWDKKDAKITTLSGGMKRRVLIAKALAHEPKVLFLDEPTAGVDVELRQEMWQVVRDLSATGVTIILTTHYIEEAEEMATRVGVIARGELILVEEKKKLLHQLGQKKLTLDLSKPIKSVPKRLSKHKLKLSDDGLHLAYTYGAHDRRNDISGLLDDLAAARISYKDLHTQQSSLEDIFIGLVKR
jgi:ABC-2 type transport system ATP-binding protein